MSKKNKPRLLYIATFPPPVHGSAVVSMQIKNSKLINNEFVGDYVNLSTSRSMDEIGKGGIVPLLQKLWRFLCSLCRTFGLLLTHRYALCYCAITISGTCFLRDAPFVLLCKLFRHKVVIHQHNKGLSNNLDKPLYRWAANRVYKNSKVILLSWYLYADIEQVVKRKNVMICPNGVRPADVNLKEKSLELKDVPHIFFLSNLIETKGCLELLKACSILKERGHKFVCDFVGGDTKEISAERFNQEIANRGLQDCVIYHGRKYGSDKDVYWAKADIFAFPTYYYNECFPLVLLETMEKGVACVSTIEGGIRDIIDDGVTGFVVPRQDAQATADAIEKLLLNPDLCRHMGAAGRKKFEEQFTEEQFEKTMLECLKKSME